VYAQHEFSSVYLFILKPLNAIFHCFKFVLIKNILLLPGTPQLTMFAPITNEENVFSGWNTLTKRKNAMATVRKNDTRLENVVTALWTVQNVGLTVWDSSFFTIMATKYPCKQYIDM